MGRRDAYEADAPAGPGGAFNLMRLLGHSRHMSSGWLSFAIKTLSVSAGASVVFGMTGYMLLGKTLGPVLPFLGGSAFGFVGGLVHRYMVDVDESKIMLERYPKVMAHHVAQVEPTELRGTTFEEWVADVHRNLRKQGVLVAALYSASDSITRLQEEAEEALVQEYSAGAAAGAAD